MVEDIQMQVNEAQKLKPDYCMHCAASTGIELIESYISKVGGTPMRIVVSRCVQCTQRTTTAKKCTKVIACPFCMEPRPKFSTVGEDGLEYKCAVCLASFTLSRN